MAELARYFQKQNVPVDQMPLSVASRGGEQIGAGISSLGQALDTVVQRDEDFWVQKTLSEVEAQAGRAWDGRVESLGDSAAGFQGSYLSTLDTVLNDARSRAPSRRAARKLELGLMGVRNSFEARARGFETEQKFLERKRTILMEADNLAQMTYRNPGVQPYSMTGTTMLPATGALPFDTDRTGFYAAEPLADGASTYQIEGWDSRYYSPRDFADGANIEDKTGGLMIARDVVAKLDWVTEQLGLGKLSINSGYRSPESNSVRADTGPNGPHTHGRALDIAVGDMTQDQKNRLYSLLKAQGFNAFGFGLGVLHAEIREGTGNGRGGDYEWTYNGAGKYSLIPVMAPMPGTDGAADTGVQLGMIGGVRAEGGYWQGLDEAGTAHAGDPSYRDYSQLYREYTFEQKPGYVAVGERDGKTVYAAPDYVRDADGNYMMVSAADAERLAGERGALIPTRDEVKALYGQAAHITMPTQPIGDTGGTGDSAAYTAAVDAAMGEVTPGSPIVHGKEFYAVSGASPTGSPQDWRAVNQYPFLALAQLTARAETGAHNLIEGSIAIATDTNGSHSYGIFGINSMGSMQGFVRDNPDLGLTAAPGTPEFDAQWMAAVRANPQKMVERQLRWHEANVIAPARASLVTNGFGEFSNDPRAIAFVADMVVQYGPNGIQKHLAAAASARSVEQFISAASTSMLNSLDSDFATYLSQNPSNRQGLVNRVNNRARDAMTLGSGSGAPITGNVPLWRGAVPDITAVPGYAAAMARIEAMIDTMGGTPAQRAAVRDQMLNTITRGWLSSLAETNPSAAMAALHSGRYDDVLTIGDEAALTGNAQSGWRAYEQEIRDAHKAMLQDMRAETSKMVADEAASLAATGRSTGLLTPEHQAMMTDADRETLDLAQFQYDIGRRVATARDDELDAILADLTPEGEGFATEQKKYDYAAKLIADRRERQRNDPAGYAVSASERVRDMWKSAMESGDPAQIQAAIAAMRQVQRDQGVPEQNVRSITASSMAHNEALLKDAENADVAFSNFLELSRLYGPEFGAVLGEMEREGGPQGWSAVWEMMQAGNAVLAKSLARVVHAGKYDEGTRVGVRLARAGMTDVARTVFDGQVKRLEIAGIEPKGNSEDTEESRDEIVGRVLGDALAMSPSLVQAVREAAISHYVNSASVGEPLDAARLEASVRAVMGGILEHNGEDGSGRFIPPVAGMTQGQFNNMLMRLTDKDFEGAFVGYSEVPAPVTAAMVRDELQFVSSGNGTYFLRYPGAGLVRDAAGLPFEINIGAKLAELAERRPVMPTTPAEIMPDVDQQVQDVLSRMADGVLSVEDQDYLRQTYGPMWAYRNGERIIP